MARRGKLPEHLRPKMVQQLHEGRKVWDQAKDEPPPFIAAQYALPPVELPPEPVFHMEPQPVNDQAIPIRDPQPEGLPLDLTIEDEQTIAEAIEPKPLEGQEPEIPTIDTSQKPVEGQPLLSLAENQRVSEERAVETTKKRVEERRRARMEEDAA